MHFLLKQFGTQLQCIFFRALLRSPGRCASVVQKPPRPVGCDLQVLWQNTLPTEGLPLGHEDHDRDDPSSDALSAEVTQEEQAFNTFSEVSPTEGLHLLTAALMQVLL